MDKMQNKFYLHSVCSFSHQLFNKHWNMLTLFWLSTLQKISKSFEEWTHGQKVWHACHQALWALTRHLNVLYIYFHILWIIFCILLTDRSRWHRPLNAHNRRLLCRYKVFVLLSVKQHINFTQTDMKNLKVW